MAKSKRIKMLVDGSYKLLTEQQILLAKHLRELKLRPAYEFQFCPERKWAADIYLADQRILIECDGGKWSGGHRRGQALEDDYEKQNWAIMAGFRVLRFTNQQVDSGEAKSWIANQIGSSKPSRKNASGE